MSGAVFVLLLASLAALVTVQCIPLDDTLRNGWLEDDEAHQQSAVYTALSSSSSPAVRDAALYLSIDQHVRAPELTNPPRMPHCIGSTKLSKALTAAINEKFAGQLAMNASVDTTYIQVLTQCDYSSFITLSGPEEIKSQLLDAANLNKLCDLLPVYCTALNLVPAAAPSVQAAKAAATGSSPPASSSSAGAGAIPATAPIDSSRKQQQRGIQRRRSSSVSASKEPFVLQSSSGSADPPLPPVLDFKCVRHNFTQVLDHFAASRRSGEHWWQRMFGDDDDTAADHARHGHSSSSVAASEEEGAAGVLAPHRRRLQQQQQHGGGGKTLDDFLGFNAEDKAAHDRATAKEQERNAHQHTFNQTFWVCDAAWPKQPSEQKKHSNVIVFLGNESPLGIPRQPIVFENARRLNALVILVEHRYYGDSLPYPEPEDERVPTKDYRWLTVDQVIEDTATVVQHVRKERQVPAAVPNIVIGGSYGGMLASWHRVVRPDVFDAAIAASAPVYYVVDTKMWRHTANRYHQFIQDAADTMSGSKQCSSTVRAALEEILELGDTAAGRDEIVRVMGLCGNGSSTLPSHEHVLALQGDVIGTFQGLAQVNNQPPVMGEMALACGVINNATAAGRKPLAAVGELFTFMASDGSSEWCYNFTYDSRFPVLPDSPTGFNSYTYQCCAEGTVYSSELPARGSDRSVLNPDRIPVTVREVEENCRNIFGAHMPTLHGPSFARHIMPLLKEYGGVVFTNGHLDGWAGGSLGLLPNLEGEPLIDYMLPQAAGAQSTDDAEADADADAVGPAAGANAAHEGAAEVMRAQGETFVADLSSKTGGLSKRHDNIAFVVYRNASHCTDTHTNTWGASLPAGEADRWRQQRALAMDLAVKFARQPKKSAAGGGGGYAVRR